MLERGDLYILKSNFCMNGHAYCGYHLRGGSTSVARTLISD
jgi:hypothetical protein